LDAAHAPGAREDFRRHHRLRAPGTARGRPRPAETGRGGPRPPPGAGAGGGGLLPGPGAGRGAGARGPTYAETATYIVRPSRFTSITIGSPLACLSTRILRSSTVRTGWRSISTITSPARI